jgi:predicted O-linked N-acetylglucosamine transferase (SPINDLY family)
LASDQNGCITFGSFNNTSKISDATLAAWVRVLAAVPGSRLLCVGNLGTLGLHRLRSAMQARGLSPDRLVTHGRVSYAEYLALMTQVDIALDCFPYNGATTTLDALWSGTPLVALVGQHAIARGGYSILSGIGLDSLIADDLDDYVATNVALAEDRSWRWHLRKTLRARMRASPVCNAATHAQAFLALLRSVST